MDSYDVLYINFWDSCSITDHDYFIMLNKTNKNNSVMSTILLFSNRVINDGQLQDDHNEIQNKSLFTIQNTA